MSDTLGTNTSGWDIPGASTNRALVVAINNKKLHFETPKQSIFSQFIGSKGEASPIIMVNDFQGTEGDTCNIPLIGRMTGNGVMGNKDLEGSEEAVKVYDQQVYVNYWRNAFKDDGKGSKKRQWIDLMKAAKTQLGGWSVDKLDTNLMNTILFGYPDHIAGATASGGFAINSSAAIPARYWYCADEANNAITYSATPATHRTNIAAGEGTLSNVETDYFGPALIEGMAAKLKVLDITPATVAGYKGIICLAHPYQITQLRRNQKWFDAMKDAMPRDEKGNPLFRGTNGAQVLGMFAGVIIMETNYVQSGAPTRIASAGVITSDNTNGENVRRAVFMGANCLAYAAGINSPNFEFKDTFDYNFKKGMAIETYWGAARGDFTSDDGNSTIIANNLAVVSTYSPAVTI
jgi:N4-gp56 family major capsid protein